MAEWFVGERKIEKKRAIPYYETWKCPEIGCDGMMVHTGQMWPTVNPGYHHQCNKCGVVWVTHDGAYPRMSFEAEEMKDGKE